MTLFSETDNSAVIVNIKQDDRTLFNNKIHQTSHIYMILQGVYNKKKKNKRRKKKEKNKEGNFNLRKLAIFSKIVLTR